MFGYYDFDISYLSGNAVWVVLAGLILIGLAVWSYFRTNPPVSLPFRIGLGLLRLIAVLALILFLLEPIVSYKRDYHRKPRVSVLIDNSASMKRSELGVSREGKADSLLASADFQNLKRAADVDEYYFAGNLSTRPSDDDPEGTAIGDAISDLRRDETELPADFWLMLTDGNSNSGRSVRQALEGQRTPIDVVGLFDDSVGFDVGLTRIDYNPVLFVGRKSKITAGLTWRGGAGGEVQVQLVEDNRVIDEKRFKISQETGLGNVALDYTPKSPGQKLAAVRIISGTEEEDDKNNRRTFSLKVLKSRLSVLLVSAAPDYELGFLNRYLHASDKYDVDLAVISPHSGNLRKPLPGSQAEWNKYDLVVFHDLTPGDLSSQRTRVESYLRDKGGALWMIIGKRFAAAPPADWLDNLLPLRHEPGRQIMFGSFQAEPDEGELYHPAVRLADDRADIRRVWAGLPPFRMVVPCDLNGQGSVTLLASNPGVAGTSLPLLAYKRTGPGKVVALAAQPLWPVKFATIGFGEEDRYYHLFLDGLISWLTAPDDFDPIRIGPEKEVFTRGEPVTFDAFAFDQGFRPIPGVTGQITLSNDSSQAEYDTDMLGAAEGKLTGTFDQLRPGKYTYRATLSREGAKLKEREGTVFVESFSVEEFDRSGDPATLAMIASMTGGRYASARQFSELMRSLNLSEITESVEGELSLWGGSWLLILFVGALALEWILRKMNHLV